MRPAGTWFAVLVAFVLIAGACSSDPVFEGTTTTAAGTSAVATTSIPDSSTTAAAPPSSAPAEGGFAFTIDPSVQPAVAALPGPDGTVRPVGGAADPDGVVTSFVSNEIVVATDDRALLDSILDRYSGEILLETDPDAYGLAGPTIYLLRVDVATAELEALAADLAAIGGDGGTAVFSDGDSAGVVAIAAAEAAAGNPVALNIVGSGAAIPDLTDEAPTGPSGYVPNVYEWGYMRRGTMIDIGVPEAWSLLFHADALDNRIPIAILDAGFDPDEDLAEAESATVWPHLPAIGTENPGECGDHACPWHGTSVAATAMALPDNSYGAAGTGGPVAEPILILTTYDWGTAARALVEAVGMGARIVNMSFGGAVNWFFSGLVLPFDHLTRTVRDAGVLLFAAAGNDGRSVDTPARLGSWEKTWHTPCENHGVVCVGGLANPESLDRHDSSNYGDVGGSVDLYAPFCVWTGPDPGNTVNEAQRACGTSMASPYAAGVAALIWAADPDRSADEVWDLMISNARTDGRLTRVNAYDAVLHAIDVGLSLEITEPSDGYAPELGSGVGFVAEVTVYSAPNGDVPVDVRWVSDRDGELHRETVTVPTTSSGGEHRRLSSFVTTELSAGTHVVTVTATTGDLVREQTVTVAPANSAPSDVVITNPTRTTFCAGETIEFRGIGYDINEPLGLPEEAFTWSSDRDGDLGTGRHVTVSDLGPGSHRIILRATDDEGLWSGDDLYLTIREASHPDCSSLPPTARILEPEPGEVFWVVDVDEIGPYVDITVRGRASDAEDDDAALSVLWTSDVEPVSVLGTGLEMTVRLHMIDEACSQPHVITLRVTDSDGQEGVDRLTIFVDQLC
jgi:subtilisin family serine protease